MFAATSSTFFVEHDMAIVAMSTVTAMAMVRGAKRVHAFAASPSRWEFCVLWRSSVKRSRERAIFDFAVEF